jgi:signal transduction histidine kinase
VEPIEKKVFISYRRGNVPWAFLISRDLSNHGYDVFVDLAGVASGDFAPVILQNIRSRAHFVLLLTPTALDRCEEPGDWLRQEIETALDTRRNIVPIFLEGFEYKTPAIANRLTRALKLLPRYQGIVLQPEYFDLAMQRLRERLSVAVGAVAHPPSEEMTASAEIALRAQLTEEFMSTLSHELRTPLNAILGWARLLRDGTVPPETIQPAAEKITRNAEALTRIIDDLLDVTRLDSKRVVLDRQKVLLAELLEDTIEALQPALKQKQITMVRDLAVAQHPILDADPHRLRQMFWSVLSNAVKFTPAGGRIEVTTTLSSQEIAVVIRDNGQGFPPEFGPLLFETFRRETHSAGGLGIGLSIALQIAELHGGTITAESAGPGQGATFTVSLPLAKE